MAKEFDKKVLDLAVQLANRKVPTNFTYEDLAGAFKEEVNKIIPPGDLYAYEENKIALFRLITETAEHVLPNRINQVLGRFANVRQFAQGDKATFTRKTSRTRAKQFITKVGLSGIYETFRLDLETFDMAMMAIGGAYQFGLEEFLDGRVDPAELLQIVMEGLEENVYIEVYKALRNSVSRMPARNQYISNTFEQDKFAALIQTIKAYGSGVEVFCAPEFAAKIFPYSPSGFAPQQPSDPGLYLTDQDRAEYRGQGYISMFAGARINVMPQSFTDEKNEDYLTDPSVAFILPTGGASERVVNIGFEGSLLVQELDNRDWSKEIHMYKKFGVAVVNPNMIGIYEDVSLKNHSWVNNPWTTDPDDELGDTFDTVWDNPGLFKSLKTWIRKNKVVDGVVMPVPFFVVSEGGYVEPPAPEPEEDVEP